MTTDKAHFEPFKNPEWNVYSFTPYCGTSCVPFIYGCTDESAQNFEAVANTEDGSCYYNSGCTQAGYLEYYMQGYEADYDDGSCITLALFGCTDPEALNYDPEANVDIDSCIDVVEGCLDIDAYNYNEEANTDADDCVYDAGCITGPGEPYWANDYCYSWVIEVDPYCCLIGWDEVCAEMYDYCGQGVTSVEAMGYGIELWPNPTKDIIIFRGPIGAFADVYNVSGQIVASGYAGGQIDLKSLPSGAYKVVINYKGRTVGRRIIKQ